MLGSDAAHAPDETNQIEVVGQLARILGAQSVRRDVGDECCNGFRCNIEQADAAAHRPLGCDGNASRAVHPWRSTSLLLRCASMAPTQSDQLVSNRNTLAQARRAIQAKMVPLGAAVVLMARLFREDVWLVVASTLVVIGLSIRWVVQYRRLKMELGLQNEYDELDENATMGAKTLLILFGVFGGMFLFLALLISILGKR
ncbi:MAG: hypothetical protein QOI41_7066 [Myxococcales bacterium]|jgi:hypothetical protein|nr:hypothetical protein [Myxococcales bacterium]